MVTMAFMQLTRVGSQGNWKPWHDAVYREMQQQLEVHNEGEDPTSDMEMMTFAAIDHPWHGDGIVVSEVGQPTNTLVLYLTRTTYHKDFPDPREACRQLYVDAIPRRQEILL